MSLPSPSPGDRIGSLLGQGRGELGPACSLFSEAGEILAHFPSKASWSSFSVPGMYWARGRHRTERDAFSTFRELTAQQRDETHTVLKPLSTLQEAQ